MINFKWQLALNKDGHLVGATSSPIKQYIIVINYGMYKLMKKTLDGRRKIVVKQDIGEDFNKVILRLTGINTTPFDETIKFLQSCEKYIKLN